MKRTLILLFILISILSISIPFTIKNFNLPTEQKISIALEHNQNDVDANAAEIILKLYNFNNYDTLVASLSALNNNNEEVYDIDEYYEDNEESTSTTTPQKKDNFISIIKDTKFDKLLLSLKGNLSTIKNNTNIQVILMQDASNQFQEKLLLKKVNLPIIFDYRDFQLLNLLIKFVELENTNENLLKEMDKVLNEDDESSFKDFLFKYLNKQAWNQLSSMFEEISNLDPESNTSAYDVINKYLKIMAKNDNDEKWLSLKDLFKSWTISNNDYIKTCNNLKETIEELLILNNFENSSFFTEKKYPDFVDLILYKNTDKLIINNKTTEFLNNDLKKDFVYIKTNDTAVDSPKEILVQLKNSLPNKKFFINVETEKDGLVTTSSFYFDFGKFNSTVDLTDINLKINPEIIRYAFGIMIKVMFKSFDEKTLNAVLNITPIIQKDKNDLVFTLNLKDIFKLTSITKDFFSTDNIQKILDMINAPDELTENSTNTAK